MKNEVADRLSSATGDRSQNANKRLAEQIASSRNADSVRDLFGLLKTGSVPQKNDAIKVIGEVALRDPGLLIGWVEELIEIARAGKGVLVWEALTALASIAEIEPALGVRAIDVFASALDGNSVIARDHAVRGLCAVATGDHYAISLPLLIQALRSAPVNQLPTYAERIARVAKGVDRATLTRTLEQRRGEIPTTAKARRIAAVLNSLA